MKVLPNKLFCIKIWLIVCLTSTLSAKIFSSDQPLKLTPEQEKRKDKLNNIMMRALTSVVAEKALGLRREGLNYRPYEEKKHMENKRWGTRKQEEKHHFEKVRKRRYLNDDMPDYSHIEEEHNLFDESIELKEAKNEDSLIKEEEQREKINGEGEHNHEEVEEEPTFASMEKAAENAIYISNYSRIMTVAGTISKLYNTFNNVIPGDIAKTDILEKTEQGLKTYKMGKDFFTIIIHESQDLQHEVDSLFKNTANILVTFEEMMILMGFDDYYSVLRTKVDTKEHQFIELDNQLKFEINDFVDKARYFLVALDNLRNISSYLYVELQPFEEKYASDSLLNILDKIDQGVGMVDAILQLKLRMEGLLNNLTNGVNKLFVVRNNMSAILIEMHKLIPQNGDALTGISILGFNSTLFVMALFWLFNSE